MISYRLFPGVCSLNANVVEHSVCSIFIGEWVWSVTSVEKVGYITIQNFSRNILHILNRSHTSYLLAYEDGTECSETLAI
jgi:hypothetical protein